MKKIYAILVALAMFVSAMADTWENYEYNTSEGREFYLTFMDNLGSDGAPDLSLKLFMAARQPATVTITMNETGQTYTVQVNGSAVWTEPSNTNAYLTTPHQVTSRSITVTSTEDITLYMAGFYNSVGDASQVMPTDWLDKEYVIQSPTQNDNHTEFAVVATEDNTVVTITPSVQLVDQSSSTGSLPALTPFTKTLQQGEVYFGSSMTSADDVSGTKICATNKVAVFSGSVSSKVVNYGTLSHVSHQMQPWKMCGTKFPIVRFANDFSNKNMVRVTAFFNNTVVKKNGTVVATLQAYQTTNVTWSGDAMMLETSKQALVCQYMTAVAGPGSAAMAFATDVQQAVSSIKFTTFPVEFNQSGVIVRDSLMASYVNIVAPTSSAGSMLLDTVSIGSRFTAMAGNTGYSYAQVPVTQGAHELTGGGKFHATVYGYDTLETPSYAFSAGLNCQSERAYFLLEGVRQNQIEVCQAADWKWHFTTTSMIPGDYTSVEWYDKYEGSYRNMGGDSIWHAAIEGEGEHTIEMRVHRNTPVCNDYYIDTVTAKVICFPRYEDTLEIRQQCKTDIITVFGETVRCDTLVVDSVYEYTKAFYTIHTCDSIVTDRVMVIDRRNMRIDSTICQGDTVELHDSVFTMPGVYVVPAFLGSCPFTDTLYLTVNPTYRFTERDTVCRSELPYAWRGKSLEGAAGVHTYYDSLKTWQGCDSLYEIVLTIGETYFITDTVSLCDVDTPYTWHGRQFSESGVHYDSLTTQAFGCDSVHRLMLTVHPTYLFTDSMTVCSNDTFVWRDSLRSGFEAGEVILYDSLKTAAGCDSVYKKVLTVNQAYVFDSVATICDYDSVVWREHHIYGVKCAEKPVGAEMVDSGYYEIADSLTTVLGCDSVYRLRLTVNRSYQLVTERDICQGESYEFDQQTLTWKSDIPGRHDSTVHYITSMGCDSLLELHLTVHEVYSIDHYDTVCNNQTYHWSDGAIDTLINEKSGGVHQYIKRFSSLAGCDSTHILYLMVKDTVAVDTAMFIPDKGSVYWDGRWYCGAQSTGQCDTVLAVSATPYVFTHVYTAANGCDSVMRMTLKIDSTYDRTLNVKTCQGDDYSFNGVPWSWMKDSVGDHDTTYYYVTKYGYDSVWHLHVHVDRVYNFYAVDSTCRNVPYTWKGHRRTFAGLEPGVHLMYDSLFTTKGCDSIYVLALTVLDTAAVEDNIMMDDNKYINWGGMTIGGSKYRGAADTVLTSGAYYFEKRFTSSECGCDSVMHLYLAVRETFEASQNITTCQHDDYLFNGETWTWRKDVVGDHDTTCMYKDRWGVDSVWRVHVRVNPVYFYPETWTMCQNDTFVWSGHGRSFHGLESGTYVYYDSLKTQASCDSVHELTLTVNDTSDYTHYITICDNDTVTWDGEKFVGDQSGDSTGTVCKARVNPYIIEHLYHKAGTGCDSVERLVLTVHKSYEFVTDTTVCSKNGFLFNDKVYYVSGTYYDSMKTRQGCDSVYVLNLTLDNMSLKRQYISLCDGDSFLYRGRVIKNRCTFVDSLISRIGGCDSVIEITVEILPTYHFRDTVDICEGGVSHWHGKDLTHEGTYYDSLKTRTGCDSIYERYLRVHRKYLFVEYDTVCSAQPYHWRNRWYTESGTYHDSLRSHGGCDSVYELRLTIYEPNITEQYVEICQGQRFDFRGRDVSQTGVYYDTILTQHGCDSIMKLVLNVTRTYYFRDTTEICDGESYAWRGRQLAKAGTYRDSLATVSGCDSIYEMYLIVHPRFHDIAYDTVCTNGTYQWRGKVLTHSGTYLDSLKSHWGCDSVYEMRLTMYAESVTEQYVEVCEGQTFDFRGRTITQPGVYYDTLVSVHGCDSVLKLVFNVTRTYYFRDTMNLCDGDSFGWRGRYIAQAGTYRDTMKTVNSGCDSIYEIYVTVHPKFYNIAYDTVCSDSVYQWRGMWLTTEGVYYDEMRSQWGCDSVYELRLTMNHPTVTERYEEICEGQTFLFRGMPLSSPGVYYDTIMSVHGCDSVLKLVLSVVPTYHYRDTAEICDGGAYSWHGRSLTQAGTYFDSLKTTSGCDSIYELYLKVNPRFLDVDYDTVCSRQPYLWRGKYLTQSGTYRDTMRSSHGCDSIYEMRLEMGVPVVIEHYIELCDGRSFNFRGRTISKSGIYYDTLLSTHGCDSVYKLVFNTTPTYLFHDTARICDGGAYSWRGRSLNKAGTYYDSLKTVSGCDSIYELYLTLAQRYLFIKYDTICTPDPYLWRGRYYTSGGTYYDSLRSSEGCDSVYELKLVMGTPTITEHYIEVCDGDSFQLRNRWITKNGTYYDTLLSRHGCDSILKIVFNTTPKYLFRESVEICDGDTFTWRGRQLTKGGTYRDSFRTVSGCDSIYQIEVTVNSKFLQIDHDTVCMNGAYAWRGKWLSQSGTYYDSLTSQSGCDSVYMINLVLDRPFVEVDYQEICEGTTFTFRNRSVTQPGTYDDTLKTRAGCDSIYRLVLNVRRTNYIYDTIHISAGSQYNFRGRIISRAGIYYDTVMGNGCRDTIYHLNLVVHQAYLFVKSDTICGQPYSWRGQTLTKSGVYYDSLKSQWSSDSVYELRLVVDSLRIRYEYDTICHGSTWWLNGRAITQPGVYCDTIVRGAKLCDSIVRRQLTVLPERIIWENTRHICLGDTLMFHGDVCRHEGVQVHVSSGIYPQCDTIYKVYLDVDTPFHQIDSITICSNESVNFRGRIVNTAGVYFDSMTGQWGCDSVYELRVTVKQATYAQFNVNMCQNQVYTSPTGKKWRQQGVYNDTLVNVNGCDSVLTYNLTVYALKTKLDTLTICRGDSGVAKNGLMYKAEGIYVDTVNRTPANGCDTIFTTYVYYGKLTLSKMVPLCQGDTFKLWGEKYWEPGTYTQFVQSVVPGDCDTLFNITVTVKQPSDTLLYASTCDGQPYWFRGRLLTQEGTYWDTARSANGCDSVIQLRLTINDSIIHATEYQTICEDTVYRWLDGMDYNKDGTYYYNPQNPVTGCTEYYTLVLNTIKRTKLTSVGDTSMCQDDEEYYIMPTFTGPAPTEYSISYNGGAVDVSGEIDNNFIVLPVPRQPDGNRVRPGNYTVTLKVGNEGCGLGTQSKNFNLKVKYPSDVLEQHFNDVVSVLNYKYNDKYDDTHSNGYTFDAYRWYLNGQLLPGETKSNLYRTSMKQGDRVYAELRRSGEVDFIPTCDIVIENFGIDTGYPVVIYRTSLPQSERTTKMRASEAATYKVCTVSGFILKSGRIEENEEVELELPYVAGCYFLMVEAENAGRRIFKIVVH